MPRTRTPRPIQYRDRDKRVWYVSEVARAQGRLARDRRAEPRLVIRFEREGEERFARWIGGDDWRTAGRVGPAVRRGGARRVGRRSTGRDSGAGRRPEATRGADRHAPSVDLEVAEMGPDALELFERQTFQQWDRASLVAVRRAIDARRRELAS